MAGREVGAVAAVDCGTNSTRLLVVDGAGTPLVRLMRITRLGQGVDATRKLEPDAINRTVEVLAEFRGVMDGLKVRSARLVATSAVRDAVNGREFLDAATAAAGVPAEVLAGDEEGRLAYSGAMADLPPVAGDDVVVDIGGGSTEFILRHGDALGVISLDLGCVRLTERCLLRDPPDRADLDQATAAVTCELDRAVAALPGLLALEPGSRLVGLAGTVSTLSALEQGLEGYDRDRIHGSVLTAATVSRWLGILAAEPAAARGRRAGMVPGRRDVIVGGALILDRVLGRLGLDRCVVSEADILDGLVASQRRP